MKRKTINIPIFHGQLILLQYDDNSELDSKYGINSEYGYDAIAFSDHATNGYTKYVLAMRKITIPKIAHESLHIVQMIMRDRGMECTGVDETESYLLQWVVYNACKFFIGSK